MKNNHRIFIIRGTVASLCVLAALILVQYIVSFLPVSSFSKILLNGLLSIIVTIPILFFLILKHTFLHITELDIAEKEIERSYKTEKVFNKLLNLSLGNTSLEEILERYINHMTSLPWLGLQPKGAVLLIEDDPGVLVLKAHRNLAEPLHIICEKVPFGTCLCGRAAQENKVVFADKIDNRKLQPSLENPSDIYQPGTNADNTKARV